MENQFNAAEELCKVQEARAVRRRRSTWGKSKLSKYQAELVQLRQAGAKYADLQFWLRKEKRVKVDRSSIMRFLKKLAVEPEVGD
jgi:hypothetical protein